MDADHFWLNDRQFARLAPHLPTDTRGKPRVDDRRVISGIVHVLKLAAEILHGDKGYDSNAVRRKIESKGAAPNIPPKNNRRWKSCFSPWLYRHRNAIELMFGRLKDFRRIATRYDRLARNFLAAVCLVATLCYWL
jgi:transposase